MTTVFDAIGRLLRVVVTIDLLVADNEFLADQWLQFKRMVKFVRTDSAKFGIGSCEWVGECVGVGVGGFMCLFVCKRYVDWQS